MADIVLVPTELLKDGWLTQDRVYEPGWWLQCYWDNTEGSHRDAIVRALEQLGDFGSVLEIGCNTGPNLRRIHQRWPDVDLIGMDIHPGAIAFGRAAAAAEGWQWTGYSGDLRELGLLGEGIADVVLSCYSLTYLDFRDINQVLAAALACAKRALVICEPMILRKEDEELYTHPAHGVVAEYHYFYPRRLNPLAPGARITLSPLDTPHQRLNAVLTVVK